MLAGSRAVDPDRDRHRPVERDGLDRGAAGRFLVLGFHRILQVEDDEIGGARPCLVDRARVARREEQHRRPFEKR